MKKSRIFMAAGAFTLVIASVFATKANKKFTSPVTLYYGQASGDNIAITSCSGTGILSTTGVSSTLYISNSGGTLTTLFYSTGLANPPFAPVRITITL